MPPVENPVEQQLRQEFNRWADQGRGEEMERHHIPITAPVVELMRLQPTDTVLDLSCGAGWATRLLAKNVPRGTIVGVDLSDQMIAHARESSKEFNNIEYRVGSAEQIPADDNIFDKVLSVEAFYYYPDQERALDELRRVLKPGGNIFILINLYKDNDYSLRWVKELRVPVHARAESEYLELITSHGFTRTEAHRIPDPSPTPESYSGKWFKDAAELREFKRIGALLLMATKPR